MHKDVYELFSTLCARLPITGAVLEIGASPFHQSLLDLPALASATQRLGLGLDGGASGCRGEILQGDAHDLSRFADNAFQLILCNSMLEHDARFWLAIAEARRVLAPGGWMILGVPSYGAMGAMPGARIVRTLARLPLVGRVWRKTAETYGASSPTLGLHAFPSDYYRFSEAAMREVLLQGLDPVETHVVLWPPRVIGVGRKPEGGLMPRE